MLLTLSVDVVYLIVLLVLRLAWGGSNGEGSAPDRECILCVHAGILECGGMSAYVAL